MSAVARSRTLRNCLAAHAWVVSFTAPRERDDREQVVSPGGIEPCTVLLHDRGRIRVQGARIKIPR